MENRRHTELNTEHSQGKCQEQDEPNKLIECFDQYWNQTDDCDCLYMSYVRFNGERWVHRKNRGCGQNELVEKEPPKERVGGEGLKNRLDMRQCPYECRYRKRHRKRVVMRYPGQKV